MKDEYAMQWAEYRHICKSGTYSLLATFILPFALVAILGILLRFKIFGSLGTLSALPFITGVALLINTASYGYLHYTWKCPRCGECFGRDHEECQYCALPKWANEDDSKPLEDELASNSDIRG